MAFLALRKDWSGEGKSGMRQGGARATAGQGHGGLLLRGRGLLRGNAG